MDESGRGCAWGGSLNKIRSVEVILALVCLSWAVCLLGTGTTTFTDHPDSNLSAMADVAPEQVWGFLFAIVGALQVVGMAVAWRGGRQIKPLRTLCLISMAVLFAFLAMGFTRNDTSTPGWITYWVFTGGGLWAAWTSQV